MKVNLFVRDYNAKYGLSRYTRSISEALSSDKNVTFSILTSSVPGYINWAHPIMSMLGYDIRTFFTTFPIQAPLVADSVNHLSVQQMGSLLYLRRKHFPTVITVHDIIPFLVRDDPEQSTFQHPFDYYFDSIAMQGIKKADQIIAISNHTKKTLVEAIGCSEEKIRVILYGVDREVFKPVPVTQEFRERYGLSVQFRYLVYVGAESPRKNLPRLIRAFSIVKREYPEVKLIKVGTPEYLSHFRQLQALIHQLDLDEDVYFIDHPSKTDLTAFYNLADVFVFPSLYEGFGLPPLEAMACGAPVVCSNATSLPEVVGDAAIQVDPYDVQALAEAICLVLSDSTLAQNMRFNSLKRAEQFNWETTAQETIAVYREIYNTF